VSVVSVVVDEYVRRSFHRIVVRLSERLRRVSLRAPVLVGVADSLIVRAARR
jgi:hypothetical protein